MEAIVLVLRNMVAVAVAVLVQLVLTEQRAQVVQVVQVHHQALAVLL